jgi:hypothetical protein
VINPLHLEESIFFILILFYALGTLTASYLSIASSTVAEQTSAKTIAASLGLCRNCFLSSSRRNNVFGIHSSVDEGSELWLIREQPPFGTAASPKPDFTIGAQTGESEVDYRELVALQTAVAYYHCTKKHGTFIALTSGNCRDI